MVRFPAEQRSRTDHEVLSQPLTALHLVQPVHRHVHVVGVLDDHLPVHVADPAFLGQQGLDFGAARVLDLFLDAQVDDLGNGGYTVKQTLTFLGGGTWVNPASEFELSFPVVKTFTRSGDDKEKTIEYTKYVAMRRSEEDAWDYIENTVGADKVAGSDHVVKKGRFQFLATALIADNITNWT